MKKYTELLAEIYSNSFILEGYIKGLMDQWYDDEITTKQLIKMAGGLDRVATKDELESVINSKFALDMLAAEIGADKNKLKRKIKELLKWYK